MLVILLTIVLACAILPTRYVVAALPAMWALQSLPPKPAVVLLSVGPVDLLATDLVLLILFARFALALVMERTLVLHRPVYTAIAIFIGVNLLATLCAGIKFGEAHLARCLVSWTRLVAEVLLVAIIAQSVRTLAQARRCILIVLITLGALAAIQLINFLGASHGFTIGEVQGVERGQLRYFGPIGDSVGFVLLLGYLISLCFAQFICAGAFLTGIMLTGGLGAIFGTVVATALFALFGMPSSAARPYARRYAWAVPFSCLAMVLAGAFASDSVARPLLERITSGSFGESGGQRLATGTVATEMIVDNPLMGVGFMGFQSVLARYGGEKYFDLDDPNGATANANNQILQSLTDSGIIGLLAFLLLLWCAARLFARIARAEDEPFVSTVYLGAFLWLLSQLFGNLAAVWLIPSSYVARFLWILLGIAIAVERLLVGESSEEMVVPVPPRGNPQLAITA